MLGSRLVARAAVHIMQLRLCFNLLDVDHITTRLLRTALSMRQLALLLVGHRGDLLSEDGRELVSLH